MAYENYREGQKYVAKIVVVGVGGAGNNAVNRMIHEQIEGVTYLLANTDSQVLIHSQVPVENRIVLGKKTTKGLGAGADPIIGRKAAEEDIEEIRQKITGADLVFIAAGEGGGTGTGAAPVIARAAQDMGALVIGIVTRPFIFEGKMRNAYATEGIEELKKTVDSLIVVSNDRLLQKSGGTPLREAFNEADKVLSYGVKLISDLINKPALINRDFADVRTVMAKQGMALISIGTGSGANKVQDAANSAVNSPLLETSIKGAKNAIVFIKGGENTTLNDANDIVEIIQESTSRADFNLIFGLGIDEKIDPDTIIITVVATGFGDAISIDRSHNNAIRVPGEVPTGNRFDPKTFGAPKPIATPMDNTPKQETRKEENTAPLPAIPTPTEKRALPESQGVLGFLRRKPR